MDEIYEGYFGPKLAPYEYKHVPGWPDADLDVHRYNVGGAIACLINMGRFIYTRNKKFC